MKSLLFLMHAYGECLSILNTLFHTFLGHILLFMQLFVKVLRGMANNIDLE